MTVSDWFEESVRRYKQLPPYEATQDTVYSFYKGFLNRVGQLRKGGTFIWEEEWDVLVILDACRYDLMLQVYQDYDFLNRPIKLESVASNSPTFMSRTFDRKFASQMKDTTLVCANPFTDKIDTSSFQKVDEVWKYSWEDGSVPPNSVTESAVENWRKMSSSKMIVWYMQPHIPFPSVSVSPPQSGKDFLSEEYDNLWDSLRKNRVSRQEVWDGYKKNLCRVLEEVERLSKNTDAERAVVTSDHGNAIGEWGVYGHPAWCPIKPIKTVPWIETSFEDKEIISPEVDRQHEQRDVEESLKSLGYME